MTRSEQKEFIVKSLKQRFSGSLAMTVVKAIESGEETQLLRELKEQAKDAPRETANFLGNDIFNLIKTY